MKRVTGIGGMFFKSDNPDKLCEWYRKHLSIELNENGNATFHWRKVDDPKSKRFTVWSPFPADTDYFAPGKKAFMTNFQVDNLDDLLATLKREGVDVDPRVESYDYDKFGWIMDPEGNRIELWERKK